MKTFKDTKYGDLTGQVYKGDIIVFTKHLDSLEGAPKEVTGYFDCSINNLKNLKHAPEIVKDDFDCSYNIKLESLEGVPKIVQGDFKCAGCPKLTSLNELLDTEIEGKLFSNIMTNEEFRENQELYNKAGKNMKKLELLKKLKGLK